MNDPVLVAAFLFSLASFLFFHPRFLKRPVGGGRRFLLAFFQWLPLVLLCWLLMGPTAEKAQTVTQERKAVVLLDDSSSMGNEDGVSGRPRYTVASEWLAEVRAGARPGIDPDKIEVVTLSENLPLARSGSDFEAAFHSIARGFSDEKLAGIVFLSDGRDHSRGLPLEAAKELQAPVFPVGLGPRTGPDSIRARWVETPATAFPGTPFLVRAGLDSRLAEPTLVRTRIRFASEEILTEERVLPAGPHHEEKWSTLTSSEPGTFSIEFRVEDRDTSVALAVAEATLVVQAEPPSVLVLESKPTRQTRDLIQAVVSSGRYRVLRPLSLPEGGGVVWELFRPEVLKGEAHDLWKHEKMTRFSASEWPKALAENLAKVSAVVLGDSPWTSFPAPWGDDLGNHLRTRRTGLLLLPGSEIGRENLPEGALNKLLAWMERREPTGASIRLTVPPEQRSHPILAPVWSLLEESWEVGPSQVFTALPPSAQVLIKTTQDQPLATLAPYELSQALMVSFSNFWTLRAFARDERGPRFEEGVWLGMLDFLAQDSARAGTRVELSNTLPSVGETVAVRVSDPSLLPGAFASGLRVKNPEGTFSDLLISPDPDWMGLGQASWTPRKAGDYEIRYASSTASIRVQVSQRPSESGDEAMDAEFLQSLAEATDGQFLSLDEAHQAFERMNLEPASTQVVSSKPLRHDGAIGILLALLFCTGWGLRRMWSLP